MVAIHCHFLNKQLLEDAAQEETLVQSVQQGYRRFPLFPENHEITVDCKRKVI